jgi:TPR repeat protein
MASSRASADGVLAAPAKTDYKTGKENRMKRALPILILSVFMSVVLAAEDEPAGLRQLRAEAEAGSAEAQLELGILYEYGYRLPDNLVPAFAWYLRAAESGHTPAAKRRDALQARMKPAEIEDARRLARELAAKAPASRPSVKPESMPESGAAIEPAPSPAAAPAAVPESPGPSPAPADKPPAADTKPLF